jgi:multidrug resistance efflux pump
VSLGFLKNNSVQVQAVSHSASFDKRTNLIRYLGMAMDEAILQGSDIVFPSPQGAVPLITKNHEEFARLCSASSIVTIPLFAHEAYYGALTMERAAEMPFNAAEVNLCRSVFALAAPALEGKRIENLPLARHACSAAKQHINRLVGPRHVGRKLAVILIVLTIIFFGFARGEFKVTADATLEGSVKRTIAAPFRGYIREARARHGDTVKEGTLLCTLDEKDLRLERTSLAGQENQFLKQHQEAIALHDPAKANVIKAQLDQIVAQIALADLKLGRTNIKAPFDGILLSGDLSQKLGSVVEQGDTLFEIAPLTGYRLILQVDESEILYVKEGQKGNLMLSAVPDKFSFVVQKITPMTTAIEGKNCFRVEAGLESASAKLRPGMEGVGKISIDRRMLISIWTLKLRNWLRLWWWSWWR